MIQVKNWGNGAWGHDGAGRGSGTAAPSSGLSYQVGASSSLKPAFSADSQKAMIERLFGAQQTKLRTGAQDQAERLALRSGMSVNGGQAVTTENEILAPQMQDLELAQMQAMLGVDRDAAQMSMEERRFQADQDRWKADRAFQERQYADQQRPHSQYAAVSGGGGGGGSRTPYDAAMGALGGAGSNILSGTPGFSPEEMMDGGQLLSKVRPPAPKPGVILSDKPSAIKPGGPLGPGQIAPAPSPSNVPLAGTPSLNSFNTRNTGRFA